MSCECFTFFGYRGKWATSSGGNEGSRSAWQKLRELTGTKMHIIFMNTWQFQVRFVAIQNSIILWSLKYIHPPRKYPLWFKLYLSSEKQHETGQGSVLRISVERKHIFMLQDKWYLHWRWGAADPTTNPVCSIRWREEAVSMLEVNNQDPGRAALCTMIVKDPAKTAHLPLIGQVLRIKI